MLNTEKMQDTLNDEKILDEGRLEEIARLRLHEDQVDEILNEYVEKAAKEFDLPVGLVSIVMDGAQKFAASHGIEGWIQQANGTPVEWSFCANSVKTEQPFIVEDAHHHEVMKNSPLVTMDNIRCYAGVPLVSKNGFVVGNFCVVGDESRTFAENEVERLKMYAEQTMDRIEARVG